MHYAHGNVSEDQSEVIIAALEMQSFSMGNTLLQFQSSTTSMGNVRT